jgi:hypothetical protein
MKFMDRRYPPHIRALQLMCAPTIATGHVMQKVGAKLFRAPDADRLARQAQLARMDEDYERRKAAGEAGVE